MKTAHKETLSPEVQSLLNSWGRDYETEVRYTKVEQFYDIDGTVELDIFQTDDY
jgi:hypothetical protein